MPRITITRMQREPIYGQLRQHLTTIDDLRVFADDDPEEAGRLALQYADDFRLFEDVGWDRDDRQEMGQGAHRFQPISAELDLAKTA